MGGAGGRGSCFGLAVPWSFFLLVADRTGPQYQYQRGLLPLRSCFMKIFLTLLAALCTLSACSRSDNDTAKATPTPNPNLQKDADRLQQATANAAREREKAAQSAASPTPTLAPQP